MAIASNPARAGDQDDGVGHDDAEVLLPFLKTILGCRAPADLVMKTLGTREGIFTNSGERLGLN
jgi:hypothetical protein